jgi:membrane protease YdiL (CAAX protease family)
MTERIDSAFWSYEDLALLLSALLPCYVGAYMLVRISGATSKEGQTLIFQGSLFALLLGALYLLVAWRYHKPFWRSLGWVRPVRGAWWSVVGGPLLAVTVSILGVVLRAPVVSDPVKDLITGRLSLFTVMAFAVVFGPIYEELLFRGFLLPLLAKTFGAAGGIVLSTIPFALLHGPQNQWAWQQVTMVGIAGLAFGFVRYRTGSTAASTILHSCFNLTQFVAFLALRGH